MMRRAGETRLPGVALLLLPLLLIVQAVNKVHALFPRTVQPTCLHPSLRQEWRELRPAQQGSYLQAVQALKLRAPGDAEVPARWNHDQFVQAHLDMRSMAHFQPIFFPWHRAFVRAYEQALQSIDPTVTIPYWDWSLDAADVRQAPVFSDAAFGSDGDATGCVSDGVVRGWKVILRQYQDSRTCIRRQLKFSGGFGKFVLNRYYRETSSFDDFRTYIEGNVHGAIHNGIGGEMAEMGSPNDPLFVLHHSFVDKIWTKWQMLCPEFATDFAGHSLDTELMPFGVTVGEVLVPGSRGACAQYSLDENDDEVVGQCRNAPSSTTEVASNDLVSTDVATRSTSGDSTATIRTVTTFLVTNTTSSMGTTTTASPMLNMPTRLLDTTSPFWLRDHLRSLVFDNVTIPTIPTPPELLAPGTTTRPRTTSISSRKTGTKSKRRVAWPIPSEGEMRVACAGYTLVPERGDRKHIPHVPPPSQEWCEQQMHHHCDFAQALRQEAEDNAAIDLENCKIDKGWSSL